MVVPRRLAACHRVSPSRISTSRPSSVKVAGLSVGLLMASSIVEAVGWAKALHRRRNGALTMHAVPTIRRGKQGGGHGAARLCPPYGVIQIHHDQLPSGFFS